MRVAGTCAAVLGCLLILPGLATASPGLGSVLIDPKIPVPAPTNPDDQLPGLIKHLKLGQVLTLGWGVPQETIDTFEDYRAEGYQLDKYGLWSIPDGKPTPPAFPKSLLKWLPANMPSKARRDASQQQPTPDPTTSQRSDPTPTTNPQPEPGPTNDPPPDQNSAAGRLPEQDLTTGQPAQRSESAGQGAPSDVRDFTTASQNMDFGAGSNSGPTSVTNEATSLGGSGSSSSNVGKTSGMGKLGENLKKFNDQSRLGAGDFAGVGGRDMGKLAGAKAGSFTSQIGGGRSGSGAAGAPASGSLSSPKTMQDFVLAAGPYKDAYGRLGLRAGTGPNGEPLVLKGDGTRASTGDLDALRGQIAREPSALARNPGFLDPARGGISRENFAGLKSAYREKPETHQTEFKHIGLEEDRDFKRSQSCDVVSGDCNAHAKKSYSEGDDVPPEDLKSIWDAIESYAGKAERAMEEALGGQKSKGIGRGLGLKSLVNGLNWSGGDPGSGGVLAAGWRWLTGGGSAPAAASATAKGTAAARGSPGAVSAPTAARESRRSLPLLLLAVLVSAVPIALYLRRRRRQTVEGDPPS